MAKRFTCITGATSRIRLRWEEEPCVWVFQYNDGGFWPLEVRRREPVFSSMEGGEWVRRRLARIY